ncbi:hypothetical protein RFI_30158 [Reticulomyxa filosa]|uniref:Uncharacterized protein n=1 Tax=Reticulomyxa filosa TaxID=46433 RepID=X6M2L8_RETFI|nr:hypothetical protein RFI_30158 [Reticulomyxa filosa]|eukprot:ETO07235.1 hypothetical protein RFI_30158 [Reticulomyxa filosa]
MTEMLQFLVNKCRQTLHLKGFELYGSMRESERAIEWAKAIAKKYYHNLIGQFQFEDSVKYALNVVGCWKSNIENKAKWTDHRSGDSKTIATSNDIENDMLNIGTKVNSHAQFCVRNKVVIDVWNLEGRSPGINLHFSFQLGTMGSMLRVLLLLCNYYLEFIFSQICLTASKNFLFQVLLKENRKGWKYAKIRKN